MQEQSIFIEALEKSDVEERAAFLDRVCADAPDLRRRVDRLLERHQENDSFLEPRERSLLATVERPIDEQPGTVIGPYRLLEQIGEGGFGVVFMAEQQQPVRRKVALKVLKPGMDTRQVVARFEAERQALALMDHPNIAHVFDGGTTDGGRPYFVMELVRGVPITEFCDQGCLSVRERLPLFVDVCHAVQHAHQKGIIHRDIKPSNVLVTLHDGMPVVKVIDFGIAKALGQQLTDKTLFTNFAQLIGTPLYMSPEQAEMSGLDVDTRSDIYSLGVLLYELLTGTTPFENERLRQVGYDEMRRIIREEEPPKPSTRISTVGKAATTASEKRQGDPRKLSKLFRGEIDWIVMKALEKDRNRRYKTASMLAADVQHYLKDEPVSAGPPSPWYRMRKFARRNRLRLAAAASVLLLVLLLGLIIDRERKVGREQQAREAALDVKVNLDLDEADALIQQDKWPEALAAAQRIEKLLAAAGRQERPPRLHELRGDLAIVEQLEEIYARPKDPLNSGHEQDDAFAKAFGESGIDVAGLPIAEAGERIRARRIRHELVRGLDFWSLARKHANNQARPDWKHLLQIAKAADQDAWRNQLRDALRMEDTKALQALADSADITRLPPQTLVLLGRTLANMGASKQAVDLLRQAHRRFPADLWINDTLGWQCLDGLHPAQIDESLRYYTAALALRPGHPRIMCELAKALMEKHSNKESMAVLDVAIELDAKNKFAWFWRARLHSRLGDNAKAVPDSSVAIELDPRWHAPWTARAYAQMALGHYDKALADCNKAIELNGKYWWASVVRAEIYHALHRDDEALADMNRAVELAPENEYARRDRVWLLISLGQYHSAREDCSKAIQLNPNDHERAFYLGFILADQGDLTAYQEYCNMMLSRWGSVANPKLAERTAKDCLLLAGGVAEPERLAHLVQRALSVGEKDDLTPWALLAQGLRDYRCGRFSEARISCAASRERAVPSALTVADQIVEAMSLYRLGDTDEARQVLDAAGRLVDQKGPKFDRGELEGAWNDWMCCRVLRREAEALLSEPARGTKP